MDLADITYRIDSGVAHITINRPERMNAFRAQTCEELSYAFTDAAWNKQVGVVVFASRACVG